MAMSESAGGLIAAVRSFVAAHELCPLSVREAMKHL
jgi:hypothetical protein